MAGKGDEKTKVDLGAKKTDAEQQRAWDRFWKKATPLWFEWLQWALILGLLTFLAKETRSPTVGLVCAFSYGALMMYLNGLFYSVEFHGFPWVKSEGTRRTLSLALSGTLAFAVYWLLQRLISEIQGKV